MTEIVGHDDAYQEGERQRQERMRAKHMPTVPIRLIDGPYNGRTMYVPEGFANEADGADLPLALPNMSDSIVIPGERRRHGVYRLNAMNRTARFVTERAYPGAR